MFFDGKTPTLGNIKMQGAALENWFSFCKENNVMDIAIQVKTANEKKKGKVIYYEPVFEKMDVSEATNKLAVEIDAQLQEYLKGYLERNQTSVEAPKAEAKVADEAKSVVKAETITKEEQSNKDDWENAMSKDDFEDVPF